MLTFKSVPIFSLFLCVLFTLIYCVLVIYLNDWQLSYGYTECPEFQSDCIIEYRDCDVCPVYQTTIIKSGDYIGTKPPFTGDDIVTMLFFPFVITIISEVITYFRF